MVPSNSSQYLSKNLRLLSSPLCSTQFEHAPIHLRHPHGRQKQYIQIKSLVKEAPCALPHSPPRTSSFFFTLKFNFLIAQTPSHKLDQLLCCDAHDVCFDVRVDDAALLTTRGLYKFGFYHIFCILKRRWLNLNICCVSVFNKMQIDHLCVYTKRYGDGGGGKGRRRGSSCNNSN